MMLRQAAAMLFASLIVISLPSSKNEKSSPFGLLSSFLVAETGFEPRDLRVMSPTSYQAAPLRDIYGAGNRDRTGTG